MDLDRWKKEALDRFGSRNIYLRERLFETLLAELSALLDDRHYRVFARGAFCLVKPDAIASGKLPAVVSWLQNRGLTVKRLELWFGGEERTFEELYKFNLAARAARDEAAYWWLSRKVYTTGPSAILFISAGQDWEVYDHLSSLKGPSDPAKGAPGELRYDLGATSRALNLFHAPDDPISALREATIFFGRQHLIDLAGLLCERLEEDVSAVTDASLKAAVASLDAPLGLEPFTTVSKIACRILVTILGLERSAKYLASVAADGDPGNAEAMWRNIQTVIAEVGDEIRGENHDSRTLSALKTILNFPFVPDVELCEALSRVASQGVPIGAWDELILMTSVR